MANFWFSRFLVLQVRQKIGARMNTMNNKMLQKKYDTVYKEGSETFYSYNSFPESLAIIQMLERWHDLNVLEIGCGEGHLASMIAYAGAHSVHAVDYSSEAISIAGKQCRMPKVHFECLDFNTIQESYDVVVLQGVVEHFDLLYSSFLLFSVREEIMIFIFKSY